MAEAGVAEWLSRQPRDRKKGARFNVKIAGGLRARRGSNPFPGAKLGLLKIGHCRRIFASLRRFTR